MMYLFGLLIIALLVFKVLQRYDEFVLRRMNMRFTASEINLRNTQSEYYRARAWYVISDATGGRDFTKEEVIAMEAMGLGKYLTDEEEREAR